MESTKSTMIACVVWLLLGVPVRAQDRTHVNTAVELAEHVQDVREDAAYTQEESGDAAYGAQVQLAQATVEQGQGGAEQVESAIDEYAGEDDAIAQADLVGEEAYIPRGRPGEASNAIMRTAQTDTPWYRNPFTALLVVLGVIGVVAAVVRRWVPAARTANSDQLKVVGRMAISSKQSVVLLHVGERVVLLGVTPDAVSTLSEITDEKEVARLLGRSKSSQAVQSNFDSVLTREFEQYDVNEAVPAEIEVPDASIPTAVPEVQEVVHEAATTPVRSDASNDNSNGNGNQNGRKSPLHLNDLLSRLRSLQKT